jgi:hypothetical protein
MQRCRAAAALRPVQAGPFSNSNQIAFSRPFPDLKPSAIAAASAVFFDLLDLSIERAFECHALSPF